MLFTLLLTHIHAAPLTLTTALHDTANIFACALHGAPLSAMSTLGLIRESTLQSPNGSYRVIVVALFGRMMEIRAVITRQIVDSFARSCIISPEHPQKRYGRNKAIATTCTTPDGVS